MKKLVSVFLVICVAMMFPTLCRAQDVVKDSIKISEEQQSFTPRCSTNQDCIRPGLAGVCQSPGEKTASCLWIEIIPTSVIAIIPEQCASCQVDGVTGFLGRFFPGITSTEITLKDPDAQVLIKEFDIKMLPAYIFSKEIEQNPGFQDFQKMVLAGEDTFYLKPEFSGVSYFIDRKKIQNRLDLFLVLNRPGMFQSIKIVEEILEGKRKTRINIHFIGAKNPQTGEWISPGGKREIEEDIIAACVEKYYPKKFIDYLACRLLNIQSLWWEDCLTQNGINIKKIKKCARSKEGQKLLEKKVKLSQELNIQYGPLFLLNNIEIFGVTEQTNVDEIIGIIDTSLNIK